MKKVLGSFHKTYTGYNSNSNILNSEIFFKKVSTTLILLFTFFFQTLWSQVTIVSDGLNNSTTLFTLTNGAYLTGNSAAGDSPASSPFASEGTHSRGVSNASATLTSNNINSTGYSSIEMNFKLASFSLNSTGNGADAADIVTVEVSPDGGTNWFSTVRVLGNSNARWPYIATGVASTAYDGNATPVNIQPAGGGNRTTDGYSNVTITGLPSVTNLRFRITLLNNDANERWVVDDFKVTGIVTAGCTAPATQATSFSSSAVTMNSGAVNWVRGTGNNVLVIARAGSAPTGPTSGTSYTANAAYGSGDALGGGFVVYNGTGTSVNLTGLTAGTTYHIAVYEYNNTGVCYLSPALTGTFTTIAISTTSDIISAGGESVTIPSSNILAGPLTSTQGLQVWQFTVRDGGGASDADNLPTILESFTITQNAGNAMNDWNVAIQSVDIFDGATYLATGVVTVNTITFSGLSVTAPDNGSKTISMRLSLNCPATNAQNLNNDDFVFQISQANVTEAVSGSSIFSAFSTAQSVNGLNVFTELTTTIMSISPTSGPANTLVTINATGGGFTGATAVTFNGTPALIFTVISDTEIQALVPAGATTGNVTITDVNCYQASFSSFTVVNNLNSGCEGGTLYSELIISEIYDADAGDCWFYEIYNGTGSGINLSGYRIVVFNNSGGPTGATANLVNLSNVVLASGDTWVIGNSSGCPAISVDQSSGITGINDDDGVVLQTTAGTVIDQWGTTGGNIHGGGTGYVYRRIPTASPLPENSTSWAWNSSNWSYLATETTADLGTYTSAASPSPSITTHPTTMALCPTEGTTLTVAGTEGFAGGLGLAYQWFVSSPGAGNWTQLTNSGVYSGVTTAVLTISSVAGLDGYQYYCQIRENTVTCYSASNAVQLDVLGVGGTNGLWTGVFDTDWCNCRNWHDGQVPTIVTNVVINQTAVNNCVVGGSCTNGVANSVSVSSSSNTNNLLTINAGSNLTITNNLTISKSAGTGSLIVSTTGTGQLVVNGSVTIAGSSGTDNAILRNESATALLDVNGSLTINTRGSLDLNANGRLNLAGDYINNNSEVAFDQATSTVIFDGTVNQSINTNAFTDVFATLTVNKASGTLTLLDPIEVVTQFNFTNGIVNSSSTGLLIFRDNALANTPSHTSHTNGPVRKIGNDAFIFPVGNGSFYRNIAISAPSVNTDHFTAQFFDVSPDAVDGMGVAPIQVPLTNISDCEHWILDRTNGASNVFVTLSYENYSLNNCSGVVDPVSLRVARWSGASWVNHGGVGIGVPTGTITTAAAVTAFSPFALATTSLSNPLPAELIQFDAVPVNKEVSVTWSTASEINVDYFEVRRSQDGFEFNTIATVDAVGTSTLLNNYGTFDAQPFMGLSYYQLNTVDNDGSSKLSNIKPVYFEGVFATPTLSFAAPNWIINYAPLSEEPITVEIYDASGKLIQTEKVDFADAAGFVYHNHLSKGMYFLRLIDGEFSYTLKALR